MTQSSADTKTVIVERELPFAPEKIWHALTQPELLAKWLMKNDFQATVGHEFRFTGEWGSVDCRVLKVDANTSLSYRWAAMGLESVVTFTLRPSGTGTLLHVEQTGFREDQQQAYNGAKYGWKNFFDGLEQLLSSN